MTKKLTEQWREGTLEDGFYYIKKNLCGIKDIKTEELFSGEFCTVPNEYIEEVLGPVPDYEKVKEMSQKIERLEFDNEALEMAHNEGKEINAELLSKNEQLEKRLEVSEKEHYRTLEQLRIATGALREYSASDNWFMEDSEGKCWSFNKQYPWRIGFKALKEMEGVK